MCDPDVRFSENSLSALGISLLDTSAKIHFFCVYMFHREREVECRNPPKVCRQVLGQILVSPHLLDKNK